MQRVRGIGGVFFRSADPSRLAEWYAKHLGVELEPYGGATFRSQPEQVTIWAPMQHDTDYFGQSGQSMMLNYIVDDIDAVHAELLAAGVEVDENIADSEHGRFTWAVDCDGNRFELWQPPPGRYPEG